MNKFTSKFISRTQTGVQNNNHFYHFNLSFNFLNKWCGKRHVLFVLLLWLHHTLLLTLTTCARFNDFSLSSFGYRMLLFLLCFVWFFGVKHFVLCFMSINSAINSDWLFVFLSSFCQLFSIAVIIYMVLLTSFSYPTCNLKMLLHKFYVLVLLSFRWRKEIKSLIPLCTWLCGTLRERARYS